MVRRAIVLLACLAGVARAGELPNRIGMYPTGGGAGGAQASLPMLESKLEVVVHGPIVEAIATQTFRNDSERVTEATYIFPLPPDAAVSAMAIREGARTIHAAIERRADAQKRYETAVSAGLNAGLLDQERPDVFTQTVAAIPAHGTVTITLRYDTVASFHAGTWNLALPLVVAPRYVPGGASGRPTTGTGKAPDTDRAPDASRITPGGAPGAGGQTRVVIEFADPVEGVASASHELSGGGKRYGFVDPHSDHDALVTWRAPNLARGWSEEDGDGGYAAVVVSAAASTGTRRSSRLVLLLDRSATTRGDADAVEHPLVRALTGTVDRVFVLGSDAFSGTGADVQRQLDDVWAKHATRFDLTHVLADATVEGPYVLVTDGLVADDAAAIDAAVKRGFAIHVIGVGPAPNRALLSALANRTGGTVRFAGPGDDLVALARDVVADLAAPPEALAVSWGTLAASDVVPATLPRLGTGQAVLVVARVKKAQTANGRTRGELFAIETLPKQTAVPGATSTHGPLARRWARLRLDELLAARDDKAALAHALHYGLVSPMTSMVAIGTEVVVEGGVKHSVAVPVSVPAGMHWQEIRRELAVDMSRIHEERDEKKLEHAAKEEPKDAVAPRKAPVQQYGNDDSKPANQKRKGTEGLDEDNGNGGDGEDPNSLRRNRQVSPAPMAPTSARDAEYAGTESISLGSVARGGSRFRLSVGLALGGAFGGGADSLVALATRLETGRLTLVGGELSIGLRGGDRGQFRALLALSRRDLLGGLLEFGAGLGLEVTSGVGPAGALSLRVTPGWHAPAHLVLRYDVSRIYVDGAHATEQDVTAGVEWHF